MTELIAKTNGFIISAYFYDNQIMDLILTYTGMHSATTASDAI